MHYKYTSALKPQSCYGLRQLATTSRPLPNQRTHSHRWAPCDQNNLSKWLLTSGSTILITKRFFYAAAATCLWANLSQESCRLLRTILQPLNDCLWPLHDQPFVFVWSQSGHKRVRAVVWLVYNCWFNLDKWFTFEYVTLLADYAILRTFKFHIVCCCFTS